jgi:hypothetical protein
MPRDTELVPRGWDSELDALLDERDGLFDKLHQARSVLEGAEAAQRTAIKTDRAAYAEALRTDGAADPGTKNADAAKAAVTAAERRVTAARDAVLANEADLIEFIDRRRPDLVEKINVVEEERRGAALEHLEKLSKALPAFHEIVSMRAWLEQPCLAASAEVRPFIPGQLTVDTLRLRKASDRKVPASMVIDVIGSRLEALGILDVQLRALCQQAGIEVDSAERTEGGAMRFGEGQRRVDVQDISKIGLTRFTFVRRGRSTRLPCALSTLESMSLGEFLKLSAANVNQALLDDRSKVEPMDADTRTVIAGLRADEPGIDSKRDLRLRVREMSEVRSQREPAPA